MMNNSKKRSFIVAIITFILTISVAALRTVHADDDAPEYTISKLNINCQIEKNGAVRLTRTVTYNFDDDADGLTYQQELPKTNSPYHVEKVEIADNNANWNQSNKMILEIIIHILLFLTYGMKIF